MLPKFVTGRSFAFAFASTTLSIVTRSVSIIYKGGGGREGQGKLMWVGGGGMR